MRWNLAVLVLEVGSEGKTITSKYRVLIYSTIFSVSSVGDAGDSAHISNI